MCGIVGVFSESNDFHNKAEASIQKLSHRGPDFNKTVRVAQELTFAHSRLAIVDLNERSNQPFFDETTGNYLIFNGEIYNYKELVKYIPKRKLLTSSDTEIFLFLISDLGCKKALELCNGMFAFAFWDATNKKLKLGRDRFGKKPLFYHIQNNTLIFGSEAKAIKAFDVPLQINHEAIINYLFEITIGKNEHSFFKGIKQIPNSCVSTFSFNANHELVKEADEKYWSFPSKNLKIGYIEAVEELQSLLKTAVDLRLSEEVKFAVMISGGLDSSSVASFAANFNQEKDITSISAVYPGDEKDESHFARMVTDKYTNLNPIWIDDIDYQIFNENIQQVVYHLESPVADGSLVAQHILMKKINEQGIKVILSGNGGDEIFAGYPGIFNPPKQIEDLKQFKFSGLNARAIYHMLPVGIKNSIYKQKHKKLNLVTDWEMLDKIWPRFSQKKHHDLLNDYLIEGIQNWTIPNLMWYEDRNSMAASIESRCPLLDYKLVEFMLQLPANFKINDGFNKKILRDAGKGIVPEKILTRRDKQGFHAPINKWINFIDDDFLTDSDFTSTFSYINFKELKNLNFRYYWRVYTLYLWFNTFIKQS